MPTIREDPEATDLLPTDAFVIDRLGVGSMYVPEAILLEQLGISFVLGFAYNGSPLQAGQVFGQYTFAQAVTFPIDFAGATGAALEAPTLNPWTCPIYNLPAGVGSSTQVATMSWTSAGAVSFTFQISDPLTFNVGDTIFAQPSVLDATMANFSYTLPGILAT